MNIHPKVAAGSAGVGVGGALSILLIWGLQGIGIPSEQFTPERVSAIDIILTLIVGFAAAYMTSAPSQVGGQQ